MRACDHIGHVMPADVHHLSFHSKICTLGSLHILCDEWSIPKTNNHKNEQTKQKLVPTM